jgi:hypothetical protein
MRRRSTSDRHRLLPGDNPLDALDDPLAYRRASFLDAAVESGAYGSLPPRGSGVQTAAEPAPEPLDVPPDGFVQALADRLGISVQELREWAATQNAAASGMSLSEYRDVYPG